MVLCTLLCACGPAGTPRSTVDAAADGVVLRRGGEPASLELHRNEATSGGDIVRDLYEDPTIENADARILPGTAVSWTIGDDGLVYTFSLRPDARWSNGDAIVADEFVAVLRRIVDPATASTRSQLHHIVENPEAIVNGAQRVATSRAAVAEIRPTVATPHEQRLSLAAGETELRVT